MTGVQTCALPISDGDDDEYTPEEKKKMHALSNCEVQVNEQPKATKEDYNELKISARNELAKKSSAGSKSQIIYCLQETFLNR